MLIEIPFDQGRTLAVKAGMTVTFDTPLYTNTTASEERLEIASLLAIHPQKIFTHLKKNVGDTVKKGELIAEKKTFFNKKNVLSDLDGVITEVDHIEGVVLVQTEQETSTQTCWFAGTIQSVSKTHLTLKIAKHHSFEIKHLTQNFGGSIWFPHMAEAPSYPVALANNITTYEVAKLEALGGTGFVTTLAFNGETSLPHTEFKLKNSFEDIRKLQLPYCITQAQHSTIICYSL